MIRCIAVEGYRSLRSVYVPLAELTVVTGGNGSGKSSLALLSPRPPAFLVLNEPENSLHPDLLPALARLAVGAAGRAPVMLVTHSAPLLEALRTAADEARRDLGVVRLVKRLGETQVEGQGPFEGAAWAWPKR